MILARRKFLSSSAALMSFVLLSGCRHTVSPGSPALVFRQGETGCGAGDDSEILGGPGIVRFSGAMTTPDPCHRLEAMLESVNDRLIVHITAQSSLGPDGFCIKCVGRAAYSGEIAGLRPGRYSVRILHGQREIKEATAIVS